MQYGNVYDPKSNYGRVVVLYDAIEKKSACGILMDGGHYNNNDCDVNAYGSLK